MVFLLKFTGRNGGKSNKEMGGSTPAPGTASGSNSGNTTPAHKSDSGGDKDGTAGGVSASAVAAAAVVISAPTSIHDPNHWSKKEKYDADAYLEGAYKKHLGRHANK